MITWEAHGGELPPDESRLRIAEVNRAWHDSGLLVACAPDDFPLSDRDGAIAGVPWHDLYMRGRPTGRGGAGHEIEQLFESVTVYLWPYAKLTAAAAAAGLAAKAGADGWDLCKEGLKTGLRAVLKTAKRVRVFVVKDSGLDHDIYYEIEAKDVDTVDAAVDAIAEHAPGTHVEDEKPNTYPYWAWSGDARRLTTMRFDSARGWVPEDDEGDS